MQGSSRKPRIRILGPVSRRPFLRGATPGRMAELAPTLSDHPRLNTHSLQQDERVALPPRELSRIRVELAAISDLAATSGPWYCLFCYTCVLESGHSDPCCNRSLHRILGCNWQDRCEAGKGHVPCTIQGRYLRL